MQLKPNDLEEMLKKADSVQTKFNYLADYLDFSREYNHLFLDKDVKDKYKDISRKAKNMYYSDFNSPIATPKIQLYKDLLGIGEKEVAKFVVDGLFDD